MKRTERIHNANSDQRQIDYFPPFPSMTPLTFAACVECGAIVLTELKDRHITWHEEAA